MRVRQLPYALVLLGAVAASAALAQAERPPASGGGKGNVPQRGQTHKAEELRVERVPGQAVALPIVAKWREEQTCVLNGPAEIVGFRVQCTGASLLHFQVFDCCIPHDHCQPRRRSWNKPPRRAVAPPPALVGGVLYGLPARIYNYGGTPENPKALDAYVECSYLNGVNLFAAGSFVLFSSGGACTVTPDPAVRRIDRAPSARPGW